MAREFTCQYANCQKTMVPIIITMPGERVRFCSPDHAAVYLLRCARLNHHHGDFQDIQLAKVEKLAREVIGDGK
jgi:hypothetical protein